jgi:hypothetical protein
MAGVKDGSAHSCTPTLAMLEIGIPGLDFVWLKHPVSDFIRSLSVAERLLPGVKELLKNAALIVKLLIVKVDTFGNARRAFEEIGCYF